MGAMIMTWLALEKTTSQRVKRIRHAGLAAGRRLEFILASLDPSLNFVCQPGIALEKRQSQLDGQMPVAWTGCSFK
jgi:hypothetical protein